MTETEKQLYEYNDTKKRIAELERQLDELKAKQESQYDRLLGAKPPKEIKTSGGSLYDPVVDAVAQLVDVYAGRIRRVANELQEAMDKLAHIEDMVKAAELSEIESRYVRMRYFEGMPVWKIETELSCSPVSTYRIKNAAIEKMKDHERLFVIS